MNIKFELGGQTAGLNIEEIEESGYEFNLDSFQDRYSEKLSEGSNGGSLANSLGACLYDDLWTQDVTVDEISGFVYSDINEETTINGDSLRQKKGELELIDDVSRARGDLKRAEEVFDELYASAVNDYSTEEVGANPREMIAAVYTDRLDRDMEKVAELEEVEHEDVKSAIDYLDGHTQENMKRDSQLERLGIDPESL